MSYRIAKMGRGFTADLTEQKQSGQPVSQNFITPADALANGLTNAPTRGIRKYRALAEPLVSHVRGAVTARTAPSATRVTRPTLAVTLLVARVTVTSWVTCCDISGLRNFVSLIVS